MKNKETLEEVALEFAKDHHEMYETNNLGAMHFGFCWGAKWQQEKMYSEDDMLNFAWFLKENLGQFSCDRTAHFEGKYLEQFKKK